MTLSFPVRTLNLKIWRAEIIQNQDDQVYTMVNMTWNNKLSEGDLLQMVFIADKSVEDGAVPIGTVNFKRRASPTGQPPTAGPSSPRSTTGRPNSSPSPSCTPSTNRPSSTRPLKQNSIYDLSVFVSHPQ